MTSTKPPIDRCRLIAFDLDGTLIDSLPEIAAGVNAVRTRHGLPELSQSAVRAAIGSGAHALIERTMTDVVTADRTLEQLYDQFMAEYRVRCVHPTLYPGAAKFLAYCAPRHTLAILTNKALEITHRTIDALALSTPFAAIVSPENARAAKPDPAGLLGLLEDLDVTPDEAIMIGDSENDFGAGIDAGVFTIGMRDGYYHGGQPEPDLWVDGFAALLDCWKN